MFKKAIISTTFILLLMPVIAAAEPPAGFTAETVASGLNLPTTFDFAPDGRIFVAEKNGTVRIIKNSELLSEPFLTLTDINTWVDRGLIGLAIDPDFETNGWVYLAYTYENSPADHEGPKVGRIVRVTADGDTMLPGSMEVLVGSVVGDADTPSCNDFATGTDCIPSDSGSHSVGGLRFGPDDKLYATIGDGAGFDGVDPNAYKAQDLDWLTGKVLRLNKDGTAPADNPFYTGDSTDNRSKVYAYGVRNAFRFDFRPLNGSLYLGDVGWFSYEEINVVSPGDNLGWPCREGAHPQTGYDCTAENPVDPIHEWSPGDGTAAVTGGAFSGAAYPAEYQDNYFFGDFHANNLDRMIVNDSDELVSLETWYEGNAGGPVSILAGPDGSIYYISIFSGELRRIVHESATSDPQPPIARDDTANTSAETPVDITVLENDEDPNDDPIDVISVTGPQNGTTTLNADDTVTYTPSAGFVGIDMFSYTLSDGVLTDTATVTVDVRAGGDPTLVEPVHVDAVRDIDTPVVGQLTTFTTSVENQGDGGPMLVDFELYDTATGEQVHQEFFDNEFIDAGETRDFSFDWLPEFKGQYRLSVGYFLPGWDGLHEWVNNAMTFSVLDREPTGDPFALTIDTVSASSSSPVVGESVTVEVVVTNTGGEGFGLVDIEVFDDAGTQVGQVFFDNEHFDQGETRDFTFDWTASSTGQFWAEAGVFGPDWEPFYEWAWHGASIVVGDGTPVAGVPVFLDALAPGFDDWSWDTTADVSVAPEAIHEGDAGLEVTYATEWAGLYLHTDDAFAADSVNDLSLAIKAGTEAGQELQVKVIDASGAAVLEEPIPALTESWEELTLSLGGVPAGTDISGLIVMGRSGAIEPSFYIDEIEFE